MDTRLARVALCATLLASTAALADDAALAPPAREAVRAALAGRREHNLASFHAYRTAGVYPHNTVRPGPLNVWRDPDGHLCAAATILEHDNQHALVMKTAATDNQIRLMNVTTGPLMDWILTSGLTLEEIDRIQLPAEMPAPPPPKAKPDYKEEDARLRASYIATEAWLAARAKQDLDTATDRLLADPALAWELVAPHGEPGV